MGTRNLVCVVLDGEMKVAQYGQWDGYLKGQGKTVIDFIAKKMKLAKFKKAIKECRWLTDAENRQTWVEAGDVPNNKSGMVNMEVADKHSAMYPGLSRDRGAQILTLIQDGTYTRTVRNEKTRKFGEKKFTVEPVRGLVNSESFAADSLFCEYAYVLDLDKKMLEIYRGFNEAKPAGRWAKVPAKKKDKYRAVTLWQTVAFSECKKGALGWLLAIEKQEQDEREAKEKAEEEAVKTETDSKATTFDALSVKAVKLVAAGKRQS